MILKVITENLPSKHLVAVKTSSRRLQGMFFSATSFRLRKRYEDVLKTSRKDILKLSWKSLERRKTVMLKTSSRRFEIMAWRCLGDILKTCLKDVLKICFGDVFKTLWRQTKCFLGISVSNKSKSVFNKPLLHKSISDEPMANSKCIN